MRLRLAALLTLLTQSCATGPVDNHPKAFNQQEFVGLVDLAADYESLRLEYELETVGGELVTFDSCLSVESTPDDAVPERYFQLLRMLKYNCTAAKLFHRADDSSHSNLPEKLSPEFVVSLPAEAIPNLGGEGLEGRQGTLVESEGDLAVVEASDRRVRLTYNDMEVDYVEVARGDFDHDGFEDIALRLDWRVMSAFGSGFDLLIVSKRNPNATSSIEQRLPAAL